eukprot:TRINITY_DN16540_c0_g1_i1.p2 TRINITY_DN16540_c0_g1~~TRINITY_DN16540_c0_g1_i1.p2  ORF type:complete len:283 (+),score=127.61 TRINITY_DN16540_c0_g1_i1:156-1004(+)
MGLLARRGLLEAHRAKVAEERRGRENPKDRQDRLGQEEVLKEKAKLRHTLPPPGAPAQPLPPWEERVAGREATRRQKVREQEEGGWRELTSAAEAQRRIVVAELEKAGLQLYNVQYSEAMHRVRVDQEERVVMSRIALLEDDAKVSIRRAAAATTAHRAQAQEAVFQTSIKSLDSAFQRECAAISSKLAAAAGTPASAASTAPSKKRAAPAATRRRSPSPWLAKAKGLSDVAEAQRLSPAEFYSRLVTQTHRQQSKKMMRAAGHQQALMPLSSPIRPPSTVA